MASMKIGQELSAAIINLDAKKEKIGLSMKVLVDNPWARVKANRGDTVKATVTGIVAGRHLTVSCLGVDGLIDIKEVPMKEKSSKLEDYYTEGDEVDAIVTFVDTRAWKLELSIKRYTSRIEREQFEDYMKKEQEKETVITLGDLFKDILK
jgi:small subunit ribosomal protein S1